MKIRAVLAINNKNGLNGIREIKKMKFLDLCFLILHPEKKGKFQNEIIHEAKLNKDKVFYWEKQKRKEIKTFLKKNEIDLLLSINFGYIFREDFLSLFNKAMNLHTSFLPFNRGSHPNVWPIIDGTPAGVTLHTMDSEIDKGEIIYQEKVVVEDTDTGKTLYEKLERKSMHVLKVGLEGFYKGDIRPYIPTKEGTYHSHKDFLNLFEIDLEERVKLTDFINKMRALSFPPFKNAFYKNEKNEKVFIDFSLRK